MLKRTMALITILVLLLAACAKHEDSAMMSATPPSPMASESERGVESDDAMPKQAASPAERMVIKTATMTIETDDPDAAGASARSIAEKHGGFVLESEVRRWNEHANAVSVTLRVPSDKFDATLGALRELGNATSENVTGEDITEEFMDLQSQLRNQRALETRFLELLGQAQTVAETIEVERELARVRTEIERMEGRSKYLKDRVDLSTIHFNANPTPTLSGSTKTIGSEVADAFGDAGEIIAVVIGGLIRLAAGLLPIAVLIGAFALVLRALLNRRKRSAGKDED